MEAVGFVVSPYRERYGAPHQPGVLLGTREGVHAEGHIVLADHIAPEVLDDLAGFVRIWVLYAFHLNQGWKPKVKPPRGPRVARGLFATRSPDRPNPIGLSCVEIVRIEDSKIYIRGFDMLDGTPVLDIKPYLPYADAFPDAKAGWVDELEGGSETSKIDIP